MITHGISFRTPDDLIPGYLRGLVFLIFVLFDYLCAFVSIIYTFVFCFSLIAIFCVGLLLSAGILI